MSEDAAETEGPAEEPPEEPPSAEAIEEVAARVAAYDESLGEQVAAAGERIETLTTERDTLEDEVDELTERVQRVQADFQNYKKRAEEKRQQLEARATENLVERLIEVRDNLDRALDQDETSELRDGLEATLREFDRILDDENVNRIDPDEGAVVDPHKHEVVHRQSDDADAIASVYRPGYQMADKILRPAQVTVGPSSEHEADNPESTATDSSPTEDADAVDDEESDSPA